MTRARDVANLIGSGNYSSTTFTATAGQTAFTIAHTQGFVQVFMNGLLLDETADYTSNGTAITLTSGAAAGDEIEVVKYNTFSVGDAVPASGGTFTGNVNIPGHVVQVVSTTKTDTTSSSSTSFGQISGLSVSITPTSSTSKILVSFNLHLSMATANWGGFIKLRRDTTDILIGDAAGNRTRATTSFYMVSNNQFVNSVGNQILDEPASTSALSYNFQWKTQSSSVAINLNKNGTDSDSSAIPRLASTITVMEIAQ